MGTITTGSRTPTEHAYTPNGAILCAETIDAEAEAIRQFTRLICNEWQSTDMNREEANGLLMAIYGLEMLITEHAAHAAQFADLPRSLQG